MDDSVTVAPGVRRLTVNLDNDDVALFEGIWPVPHGVALHSYLIQGDRLVIIDPWDAGGYGPEELGVDLEALGLGWNRVAAVAFTKAPLPDLVERLRGFQPSLEFWGLPSAGTRHDLGQGMTLEGRDSWWVGPGGVLFSGDAFAGLGWIETELWTEDLGDQDARYFEDEALRWFAQRPLVPESLPQGTKIVAPAHGCLWRSPEAALAQVRKFEGWATDGGVDEVTVVWPVGADVGADALVGGVLDADAGLNLFRVPGDDTTALAAAARRSGLVVIAQGLDEAFLLGLDKEVWRPPVTMAPAELRAGLVERWTAS